MSYDLTGVVISNHERTARKVRTPRPRRATLPNRLNTVRNQGRRMFRVAIAAEDGTVTRTVVRAGHVRDLKKAYIYHEVHVGDPVRDAKGKAVRYVPKAR